MRGSTVVYEQGIRTPSPPGKSKVVWVSIGNYTLTQMKISHIISLNSYFVSIHVIVRFTHKYQDFVADKDYAIFIQIPGLFKRQRLKNVFLTLHVLRTNCFTNSFKTDKKTFAAEY